MKIEVTPEIKQAMDLVKNTNKNILISGQAGCVDKDTQYLTQNGWINISEYNGEKIAVYNKDGIMKFEKPIDFVKYEANEWYEFNTKYGLSQKLSPEHNVYYVTSKGNLYHKSMEEVYKNHQSAKSFSGRFITTFNYNGNLNLDYKDDYIRLLVAMSADGNLTKRKNKDNYWRFNLKKECKISRLEYLLKSCDIDYKVASYKNGYKTYTFSNKDGFKIFPKEWYSLSKKYLRIIKSECILWDGNSKKLNTYYSNIKENADFIQFVFTSLGFRSTIYKDTHRENINYCVSFNKRVLIGLKHNKTFKPEIKKYKAENEEYKYCFTTSTKMWVARRNDKIFITGNTGKSSFLEYFKQQNNGKYQCAFIAPTGTAAVNIGGCTIHKFFGFGTHFQNIDDVDLYNYLFAKNDNLKKVLNSLDFLIIDEISMVRADLMDAVIEMLSRVKKRVRIIALGDLGQLRPVLTNNEKEIFYKHYDDTLFYSAKLFENWNWEKVLFKKVFRQKDPVMKEHLNNIRNKRNLAQSLAYFNERYDPDFNGYGIKICNQNNQVDEINSIELEKIKSHEIVVKADIDGDFPESAYPTPLEIKFKVGAKVMTIRNHYQGDYVNGTIGTVMGFNDKDGSIRIKTDDGNTIFVERNKWENKQYKSDGEKLEDDITGTFEQYPIRLAYAITSHKSQGKTFDSVIIDRGRGFFALGQLYVALSRCTSYEGIHLIKKLQRSDVK